METPEEKLRDVAPSADLSQPGQYAIITAFSPDFGADFELLYDSIRRITRIPIIVVPLNHSEEELQKLRQVNDTYIVEIPQADTFPLENIGPHWIQWYKPLIIQKALQYTAIKTALWLDVDLVVLDDLRPLFAKALESFFVVTDHFAPKTCLNDSRLYSDDPIESRWDGHPNPDVVLNSGVIGLQWPRDKYIIDDWLQKTQKIASNPHLKEYVSLYDQGVLLWSMRELGILDKILYDKQEWNRNAKRNSYEINDVNIKWPAADIDHMGGDVLDEVKYDNPNTTIAHYAGLPKLSNLCYLNHPNSCQYRTNKHNIPSVKLFGVGIERAGTHSLAEMLRRSSRSDSWVRHEFSPPLAAEAEAKWRQAPYDPDPLRQRCEIYNRRDVQLIAEVNHRLGFFIPEIKAEVPDAKFVLLLRNPIDLIRSRLLNFSCWSKELHKYPGFYQFAMYECHKQFSVGSDCQNRYRLYPGSKLGPIEMHVWEIKETLRYVLKDLRELSPEDYRIIWIENFQESYPQIESLIPGRIWWREATKWSKVRFGASGPGSEEMLQWIKNQVHEYSDLIISIFEIFKEFDVPLPEQKCI